MMPESKGPAAGNGEGLKRQTFSKTEISKLRIRRQRLSAWTSVLDAIGDWQDRLRIRLRDVNAGDVEEEVRIFRDLCSALSDYLEAEAA